MDKMREEFEIAWQVKGMDDEGNLGGKPTRSKIDTGRYVGDAAQFAWMWWKRSRESLSIELPRCWNHEQHDYREELVENLEEVGVNYK